MTTLDLRAAIAMVICPRFPIGIDGLDFGDGGPRLLPGGFCCFAVDLPASLDAIAAVRAGEDSVFPFIASDLERGAGQQIAGLSRLPPALALGAADDEGLCEEAGELTAREARAAGVALVFAPVVDVATQPRNPIVAIRAFGNRPEEVGRLAAAFARGVHRGGAIATAKHYPGHGPTSVDSHLVLPTLDVGARELETIHEVPFRRLIAEDVGAIMIGHLHVAALDPEPTPATLSAAVIGRLRDHLGYRGLVVTDALDMGAIAEGDAPDDEPAVRCIRAGADIALLPRDPSKAARNLLAAVRSGHLPEARLREAAERIRTAVRKVDISRPPQRTPLPSGRRLAERIASLSITHDDQTPPLPPLTGKLLHLTVIDDGNAAAREPVLRAALAQRGVTLTDDLSAAEARVVAVFSQVRHEKGRVLLDGPRREALKTSLRSSALEDPARPSVLVSIGCPQALLEVERTVCTLYAFDDDDASLGAVAAALAGQLPPTGRVCFEGRPPTRAGEGS